MNLIDIGANLTHQSFSHDFDAVVEKAKNAGLAHVILTGTDLETSTDSSNLAKSQACYFSSTAGFHPHVAASCSEKDIEEIRKLASNGEVVAVGETGLDYNRNYSPRKDQLKVFEQHLEIATELAKPVFLHQRDAHEDFIDLLKKYRPKLCGGVVHCFTDNGKALEDYLELDMYIGITGWVCDQRRGQSLQQLVSRIPPERLLVETDAPYLLPRSLRPKPKSRRNEPRFLGEVIRVIAEHTGRDMEQLAAETSHNAIELFSLKLS